jgi:hypothetical protein
VQEVEVVDVRPVEGIQFGESEQDYLFRMLDEMAAEVLEKWLEQRQANPDQGFAEWLEQRGANPDQDGTPR